uniref:Uncharacterized protein n=1 Tax=Chaetoceros debilis TaxID=122233 RepID=A0A7S3Q7G7_9STRA
MEIESLPFSPTRSLATEMSNSRESIKRTLFSEEDNDADANNENVNSTINNTNCISSNYKAKENTFASSTATTVKTKSRSPSRSPKPLSTITNSNRNTSGNAPKTFRNKWIANTNMNHNNYNSNSKKNSNKENQIGKARAASNPRANISEIRKKIAQSHQKSSTPLKTVHHVNIPMNKVTEMRRILIEHKKKQEEKLRNDCHMSSKKRAEIKDRLNKVKDIHKLLSTNGNGNPSSNSSVGSGTGNNANGLNLPANRVSDMKNWLVEFANEKKKHCSKYDTKTLDLQNGYVPRSGGRHQSFEGFNSNNNRNSYDSAPRVSRGSFDRTDMPLVSDLKKLLVDFEMRNKAHNKKLTKRPEFRATNQRGAGVLTPGAGADAGIGTEEEEHVAVFGAESSACDEEDQLPEEIVLVENLDEDEEGTNNNSDNNLLNVSMMPVADGENANEWQEEYEDLSNDIDIDVEVEPVLSADWEKESVASPEDFSAAGSLEEDDDDVDDTADVEKEGEDTTKENPQYGGGSNDGNENNLNDSTRTMIQVNNGSEQRQRVPTPNNMDIDLQVTEEDYESFAMSDDTISKLSFDESGASRPVGVVTMSDFAAPKLEQSSTKESEDVCSLSQTEDLLGVDILSKSCCYGQRFTNTSFVAEEVQGQGQVQVAAQEHRQEVGTKMGQMEGTEGALPLSINEKKKKGLGHYLKALACFSKKNRKNSNSEAVKLYEMYHQQQDLDENNAMVSISRQHPNRTTAMVKSQKQSTKSLELSPDSYQQPAQGKQYLPTLYKIDEPGRQGQDLALQMVANGMPGYNVADSPMSLASAYRRGMSPTSTGSYMSGFTDVDACAMSRQGSNVAQHVGWLQDMFEPPQTKKVEKMHQF